MIPEHAKIGLLFTLTETEKQIRKYYDPKQDPEFNDPEYRVKHRESESCRMALIHIDFAKKALDPPPVEHCPTCNHIIKAEENHETE